MDNELCKVNFFSSVDVMMLSIITNNRDGE